MDDVVRPSAPVAAPLQNGRSNRSGRSTRGPWWHDAPAIAARIETGRSLAAPTWYRIGAGWLGVASDHAPFAHRFRTLFGECAGGPPDPGALAVRCGVRSLQRPAVALVTFDDPEPLDQVRFVQRVFADRGYEPAATEEPGWSRFGDAILAAADRRLLVQRGAPWQSFVGSLAVNRVLRLQRDVLFFHAAAAGIGGRGVLIVGPKGSGKTTLSLALAARGHGFFGDEMTGVRMPGQDVVPVRRAASVRPGPRARAVTRALAARRFATDRFPDGTTRRRVGVGALFPAAAAQPATLAQIVFLRGFAPLPHVEPFAARSHDVCLLTPLACTLWDAAPQRRAMQILSLLAGTRCAFLDVGEPDATARAIEQLVEAG